MLDAGRSYKRILPADLLRLAEIARRDRESFFLRNPRYAPLRDRVVAVALCQGAGLHFVNGRNGIKDIDVWTFYGAMPGLEYPPRRPVASYDFGDPKFGTTPGSPQFIGRRVDCLGRSFNAASAKNPVMALRNYLMRPRTRSASELAAKAVVVIEPNEFLGTVAWPLDGRPAI